MTAGSTTYVNNALGLSVAADTSGTTAYIRDNQGKLTEQRTPSGNHYYLFDGLGSVVALTDSSGTVVNTYSYDPYGKTKSSTGTVANPWRFGGSYGAYHDADTGLYKIGMRYYSPELGRWTQQDPVVHLFDPVQLNRYAYAGCNPSNVVDPSGACATGEFIIYSILAFSATGAMVVTIFLTAWVPLGWALDAFMFGLAFGAVLQLSYYCW